MVLPGFGYSPNNLQVRRRKTLALLAELNELMPFAPMAPRIRSQLLRDLDLVNRLMDRQRNLPWCKEYASY